MWLQFGNFRAWALGIKVMGLGLESFRVLGFGFGARFGGSRSGGVEF